jgi:hypothetical protein
MSGVLPLLQKLVDDLEDATNELMLAEDDELVKLQVMPGTLCTNRPQIRVRFLTPTQMQAVVC